MSGTPQGRHRRTVRRVAGCLAIAAVAPGLVGCGDDDTSTAAVQLQPASTTTTITTPSVPPTGPTTTVPSDVLPDGTSFGYLESIDIEARTIRFDLAQLFEGDAAVAAAKADGQIPADQDFIENDYYIRNVNTKLRTVPLASDASIRVLLTLGSPDQADGDLPTLAGSLAAHPKLPVSLVVSDGEITKLSQVFFP